MKTARAQILAATTLAAVDNPHVAADPSIGIAHSVRTNGASSLGTRLGRVMLSNISKYCIAYRLILEGRAAQKEAVEKIKDGAT